MDRPKWTTLTLGADGAVMHVRGAGTLLVFASERPARVEVSGDTIPCRMTGVTLHKVGVEAAACSWDEHSRLVRVAVSALEEGGCQVVLRF